MSLGLGLGLDKQRSVITFSGTFPANPYPGQTGIVDSIVWVWDGSSWDVQSITGYDGEMILVDTDGETILLDYDNQAVLIEV